MKKISLLVILVLAGCASKIPQPVFQVSNVDMPDFRIRKVYSTSEVVRIKPDYQTVLCADCAQSEAFNEADEIYWVRLSPQSPKILDEETLEAKHFKFDNWRLTGDLSVLDKVLKAAKENPESSVKIVGHTDSKGSDAYNKKLGLQRAKSVANWLILKGLSVARIETTSAGESSPVASNATEAGRAKNRRAQITVVVLP